MDYVLVAIFGSADKYGAFQAHVDHERGRAAWRQISTWNVADLLMTGGER